MPLTVMGRDFCQRAMLALVRQLARANEDLERLVRTILPQENPVAKRVEQGAGGDVRIWTGLGRQVTSASALNTDWARKKPKPRRSRVLGDGRSLLHGQDRLLHKRAQCRVFGEQETRRARVTLHLAHDAAGTPAGITQWESGT